LRDAIGHLDPDADQIDELLGGPHLRFSEPRPTSQLLDAPLMGTVKAGSGCYDVHPSFLRRFTVRELACIQTFPEHHQFAGIFGKQRRQVGNAVPPVMAEALLRQVKEALEESDVRTSLELANGAQNDLSRFPIIGLKLCMADSDDVEIVREVPASCPLSLCVVGKSLGSESTNNGDAPRGIHSDFVVRENGWYNNGSEYDDPIILD
jgi:DNA (cytosine-5)-methyltransferase 1